MIEKHRAIASRCAGRRRELGSRVVRFLKLILLLVFAVAAGFLFALLRPRRVTTRRDVVAPPTLDNLGGEVGERTG